MSKATDRIKEMEKNKLPKVKEIEKLIIEYFNDPCNLDPYKLAFEAMRIATGLCPRCGSNLKFYEEESGEAHFCDPYWKPLR